MALRRLETHADIAQWFAVKIKEFPVTEEEPWEWEVIMEISDRYGLYALPEVRAAIVMYVHHPPPWRGDRSWVKAWVKASLERALERARRMLDSGP